MRGPPTGRPRIPQEIRPYQIIAISECAAPSARARSEAPSAYVLGNRLRVGVRFPGLVDATSLTGSLVTSVTPVERWSDDAPPPPHPPPPPPPPTEFKAITVDARP